MDKGRKEKEDGQKEMEEKGRVHEEKKIQKR